MGRARCSRAVQLGEEDVTERISPYRADGRSIKNEDGDAVQFLPGNMTAEDTRAIVGLMNRSYERGFQDALLKVSVQTRRLSEGWDL